MLFLNFRSELKLKANAQDDGAVFTCEANNGLGTPVSANVSIIVTCKYLELFGGLHGKVV